MQGKPEYFGSAPKTDYRVRNYREPFSIFSRVTKYSTIALETSGLFAGCSADTALNGCRNRSALAD